MDPFKNTIESKVIDIAQNGSIMMICEYKPPTIEGMFEMFIYNSLISQLHLQIRVEEKYQKIIEIHVLSDFIYVTSILC